MTVMLLQPISREAERLHAQREELVERIGRAIRTDGTQEPLPGLHVSRIIVGCMGFGDPSRGTHAWAQRTLGKNTLEIS